MKPMFKKMCFLLAMYQLVILIACNKCTCPPVQNKKINLQSITAENIIWGNPPSDHYDYQILYRDSVATLNYGIILKIETKIVLSKPKPCVFVNSAYACDCELAKYSIEDSIMQLKIIAQTDIGNVKKGEDLSNSFSILYTTHDNKIAYLPSKEAISEINYSGMNNVIMPMQFICTDKSLESNWASFTIQLKLKSGIEYIASTKSIYLE